MYKVILDTKEHKSFEDIGKAIAFFAQEIYSNSHDIVDFYDGICIKVRWVREQGFYNY